MSIPSVGYLSLVLIVTSKEDPKGLGESSKSSSTPELVQITGSLSSSGMIWGKLLSSGVEWLACYGRSEDGKKMLLVGWTCLSRAGISWIGNEGLGGLVGVGFCGTLEGVDICSSARSMSCLA